MEGEIHFLAVFLNNSDATRDRIRQAGGEALRQNAAEQIEIKSSGKNIFPFACLYFTGFWAKSQGKIVK